MTAPPLAPDPTWFLSTLVLAGLALALLGFAVAGLRVAGERLAARLRAQLPALPARPTR